MNKLKMKKMKKKNKLISEISLIKKEPPIYHSGDLEDSEDLGNKNNNSNSLSINLELRSILPLPVQSDKAGRELLIC